MRRHVSSEPVVGRAQNEMEHGPASVERPFSEGPELCTAPNISCGLKPDSDVRTGAW